MSKKLLIYRGSSQHIVNVQLFKDRKYLFKIDKAGVLSIWETPPSKEPKRKGQNND